MSDAENNGLSPAKEENPPEKKEEEEEEPMEEEKAKEEAEEEKKEEPKEEEKEEPPPKKSPKKSPKKAKKQAEEEEEDDDEEPRLGLLERPVVIESGKREKKKVERLEISLSVSTKEKKIEIPEGKGTKLGEIPRVDFQLTRTLADDLKPLHRILYGRNGVSKEVKRNIRKFCGFAFTTGSDEYEKKRQALSRFTTAMLKATCENLDLERSGTKENIIERVLEFLLNPSDSGRPLPRKKRGKSAAKGTKRKRKSKEEGTDDKKGKGSKKKAKSKEAVDDSDEEDEDEEEKGDSDEEDASEEESASESEEEDADEPPKKKTKGETPKKAQKKENKKKDTKKAEKKEKKAEKKEKKEKKSASPKKKASADSDESSDDDEPLVAKKQPPNDDELRDVIKKILDGANLEEVTMKTVCKQVYAKYPDFDLTDRKDFIKSTVKQIIR